MNLFNDEIKEVYKLISSLRNSADTTAEFLSSTCTENSAGSSSGSSLASSAGNSAEMRELPITDQLLEDVGSNNMIFRDECAYELGDKNSLSFELSSSSIKVEDKIYLVGKDLSEIQGNEDFVRITLLQIEDEGSSASSNGDSNGSSNGGGLSGDALYNRLEQIKLTKYKVSPKGYMLRTSTGNKEKVRVSKELAKNGSFSQIGSAYLQAYKKLDYVEHVTLIFVVGESDLYESLRKIANRKAEITDTIDHILKGFMINDCDSCSAKDLCDEVEGLREIHQSVN